MTSPGFVPELRPRGGAHDEERAAREETHSTPGMDVPEDVEGRLDALQALEEAARPGPVPPAEVICRGGRA